MQQKLFPKSNDFANALEIRKNKSKFCFIQVLFCFVIFMCLVPQSCPTLLQPHRLWSTSSSVYEDFAGNYTGVGCHALLQGIFPIQGSSPGLQHCRWILYHLSHQGSSFFIYINSLNKYLSVYLKASYSAFSNISWSNIIRLGNKKDTEISELRMTWQMREVRSQAREQIKSGRNNKTLGR